ncbi:MAG: hypothetical protein Q9217_002562 [Psora testacea]
MARPRKKKRTHVGARNGPSNGVSAQAANRDPKSMVIRIGAGEVGASVSQLVKDVRSMMEPGTAGRLKERRSNRLRDYTAMAGPLGVSHLLLFSRSEAGNINLRLALTPRGPTLHFRVEQYSLAKDVRKAQRHPRGGAKDFLTAPLLVMNNFAMPATTDGSQPAVPKHLETLTTMVFQSLFPPISPQATPLSSIRRVLLLNREMPKPGSGAGDVKYTLNLRHYAISTKRAGLSRSVRRLNTAEKLIKKPSKHNHGMPNLSKLNDVADYLLDPSAVVSGLTSASETEIETDAEVEVLEVGATKVLNKQQMFDKRTRGDRGSHSGRPEVEKRAIKLVELGPRMKLRMAKIEEGVCGGKVMWHEYLNKTPEEVLQMEKLWDSRRREKEERRRAQKENIERKREAKGIVKGDGRNGGEEGEGVEDLELDDKEDEGWNSEGSEDHGAIEINQENISTVG